MKTVSASKKQATEPGRPRRRSGIGQAKVAGGLDDSPKGRILRAAAHLFVTRGFAGATVRDLAAEVGIQSGSLFHHFRNKSEILEAVMVEVIELNTKRMQDALAQEKTPLSRVEALVRCELTSINGDTSEAMSLLLLEWNSLDAAARKRVLVLRDRYESLWLQTLEAAHRDLVDMEPFVMRRLIAGMNAQTAYWFRPGQPMTIEDLTECVMTTLRKKGRGR